jgi:pimeloyl-ACP methyl ester carboxylesterase
MIREVGHDGLVLRVRDEGPRSGEAVLLLHGFPQDGGCWDDVVPALHRAGLRTLAPDQRGYSPGARPDDVRDYRPERLTGDALAVLDACGVERAHGVGHDWGGALAWRLGAHHPARVMSLTVLSTPHPAALARSMGTSLQALRSWYTLAVQVPVVPEVVLSRTLGPALRASGLAPGPSARYAARLSGPGDLRGPLAWYRAAARRPPWQLLGALTGDPGVVHVPTTYVWGRHDLALGGAAARHTREYVLGEYLFTELDAGHWLPEMHPTDVVDAVLDRALRT